MSRSLILTVVALTVAASGRPVQPALAGEIELAPFVTHTLPLERINEAFDLMHDGKSIRTVIHY